MLTLYTAVGSLKFERTNGKPVPYIINNEKEYGMSKEELLVWSCLAFQILTYPELEQVVERNCADSGQSISLPLSHYLNRLLLRGLLVKGMGVSAVDALYHLLGTLTITPVEDRFLLRLGSALLLSLKGQVRFRDIPRLLRRVKCTPTEQQVLSLAGKAPLSTAELLLSMERGIRIEKETDILEKLPQGLDTVIGTKGTYLSGGEAQRIALARAILKDAPIVVLDEATAFADPENEVLIQKAFARLTKGRTVIMIAHRLSTVVGADKILVLDGGRVVEQGTHQELAAAGGLYSRMWSDYNQAIQWKMESGSGKEGK